MRWLIVSLLVGFGACGQASEIWHWQQPCEVSGKVRCEVWFRHFDPVKVVFATVDGNELSLQYQSYSSSAESSINALLVHSPGLNDEQQTTLNSSITAIIKAGKSNQLFGLYGSSGNFRVISPITSNKQVLLSEVSQYKASTTSDHAIDHLKQMIQILGGYEEKRRVLTWLTTGADITDADAQLVSKLLSKEKVRLVVLLLTVSELQTNQFANLSKLSTTSKGVYSAILYPEWTKKIPKAASISNNGGKIEVDSSAICGSKKIKWVGETIGRKVSTSHSMSFPDCAAATEEDTQAPPATPSNTEENTSGPPSSPTEESGDNEQESHQQEDSPQQEENEQEENSSSTNEEESEQGTSGNAPAEEEEGEEENQHNSSDSKHFDQWIVPLIGASLLVLLLLLVFLVLRRRKKPETDASQENAESQQTPSPAMNFGYLVARGIDGVVRFPLNKSSITVGRANSNDIVINDDTVSANHIVIKCERNGDILLTDLNSSNGTRVNSENISQQVIQSGDKLELGSFVLQLEAGGLASTQAPEKSHE